MSQKTTNWAMDFYGEIEPIELIDPLASLLGAVGEDEKFVYRFTDAAMLAGHTCPAVAGAFKLTQRALEALYGDETPVRGTIKVLIKGTPDDLAYGPQSQVITQITGAATELGFKGLGGKFKRHGKLFFDTEDTQFNTYIFKREDTGKAVKVVYSPQAAPQDPRLNELTPKAISGAATDEEYALFKELWQDKVRKILLEDREHPGLIEIEELTDFAFPDEQ